MVRFEHVGLRYGLGPEVLRDLTFHIDPHSFQFLTGPSGAGKTSLLRLLFVALRPTRGLITMFGHDIATLGKGEFFVCFDQEMYRTYVWPAWMSSALHAEAIARHLPHRRVGSEGDRVVRHHGRRE